MSRVVLTTCLALDIQKQIDDSLYVNDPEVITARSATSIRRRIGRCSLSLSRSLSLDLIPVAVADCCRWLLAQSLRADASIGNGNGNGLGQSVTRNPQLP